MKTWVVWVAIAGALAVGCGEDAPGPVCSASEVEDCQCADARAGERACQGDGQWAACECAGAGEGQACQGHPDCNGIMGCHFTGQGNGDAACRHECQDHPNPSMICLSGFACDDESRLCARLRDAR